MASSCGVHAGSSLVCRFRRLAPATAAQPFTSSVRAADPLVHSLPASERVCCARARAADTEASSAPLLFTSMPNRLWRLWRCSLISSAAWRKHDHALDDPGAATGGRPVGPPGIVRGRHPARRRGSRTIGVRWRDVWVEGLEEFTQNAALVFGHPKFRRTRALVRSVHQ